VNHDGVTPSWLSLGQALRPGDARAYRDSRVNRGAAQTVHPFGWKGPLRPGGGSDDGTELQGDSQSIRDRPAAEPPYQAVCEGILDFGLRHRDMLDLVNTAEGELEIPLDGPQRPLIDFEDTLAEVLRERYAVPAADQISPAVWARASIGALRTALTVAASGRRAPAPLAAAAPGDPLRACFAALQRGSDEPGDMRLRDQR
jgi:hypothetical protein